ncbi:hypothetical protein ABIE26_004823 [Pedobacter africanus]|uniref:Uncharacterized protein n=1 Tax=Pedobacter africanus TaxID=151894 RepID=A0ACC6L2V6_9SPHI|nr:RagB/SusD family nutrient uptake outer membrane protein [Pedobacter africanus]MDR6785708.1 hypothetical protein [Pedobacter africanus]
MKNKIFILIASLSVVVGCKKFVEVDSPSTNVTSANIYEKDAMAASVLTGIYTKMSVSSIKYEGLSGICFYTGLSSDELTLIDGLGTPETDGFYTNTLGSQISGFGFWNDIYSQLYVINSAIEGISNSTSLTPTVKKQLLGEAKFLRGFCLFYLVNLYGDVPLVLSTDYKDNTLILRSAKTEVWKQIVQDLKEAQTLLNPDYLDATLTKPTQERVRPTKSAATAMLARAHLYLKDWKEAEAEASALINNPIYSLVTLDEVFLKNSKEAIWQLQPVHLGDNSQEAIAFILTPEFGLNYTPVSLSESLLNDFDLGDQRKLKWINNAVIDGITYTFAYKYKKINLTGDVSFPVEEYSTILRLSEQYLIRGEARIQQGKIAEGITDLNVLRDRATDKTVPADQQLKQLSISLSMNDALTAVEHERQIELFSEGGHRWLDLKRTGRVDDVMRVELPKKDPNSVWKSFKQYYPISLTELKNNPRLNQNEGY